MIDNIEEFVKKFDLPIYHTRVLIHLIILGKSKALELAKVSSVPRSRIYDILEDLFKLGFVNKKNGSPTIYYATELENMVRNMLLYKQQELKTKINEINELKSKIKYIEIPKINPKEIELLKIVQVGVPSETETENIINSAKKNINIISRAFEYYNTIRYSLNSANKRNISIKILLLNPKFLEPKDAIRQKTIALLVKKSLPKAQIKFSTTKLPIRMTLVDADKNYTSGSAVFVVEQTEIPLFMREAAITKNPSLVYGLKIYFDNLWNKSFLLNGK